MAVLAEVRSRWALDVNLERFKPAPYIRGFEPPLTNGVGLNNGHIYITVYNDNLVKQCDVDAVTGAISGCSDVTGFNGPAGNIAFY